MGSKGQVQGTAPHITCYLNIPGGGGQEGWGNGGGYDLGGGEETWELAIRGGGERL